MIAPLSPLPDHLAAIITRYAKLCPQQLRRRAFTRRLF